MKNVHDVNKKKKKTFFVNSQRLNNVQTERFVRRIFLPNAENTVFLYAFVKTFKLLNIKIKVFTKQENRKRSNVICA